MTRKSDARPRMIAAARRLFRERGYTRTALADVIAESRSPRGSTYFHFPGGKQELAFEVTLLHTAESIGKINRAAASSDSAADLVDRFVRSFRDELVSSDYREGCAVAPIVTETATTSPKLQAAARRGFQDVIATLARRLVDLDVAEESALPLALHTVASFEGALVVGKALGDDAVFDAAITGLRETVQSATRPAA